MTENIKVKFYELDDEDNIVWEDYGKFSDLDVHHQYAIVFKYVLWNKNETSVIGAILQNPSVQRFDY